MRYLSAEVAGAARTVYVPQTAQDAAEALEMISRAPGVLAFDTETTGLDIFSPGYRVRLVQFGTKTDAWVFPVEAGIGVAEVRKVLRSRPALVAHNATFDIQSLAVAGLVDDQKGLWDRVVDTRILAHLLDPRGPEDGGVGMSLKPLAAAYFDDTSEDSQKALKAIFHAHGWTISTGWAAIDLWNPDYLRYAGVDTILTSWLLDALRPPIVARGFRDLSAYEHELARICSAMSFRGMAVDREYLEALGPRLTAQAEEAAFIAAGYGVANVNSTAQVAEALVALGVDLAARTASGKPKVDKEVLGAVVAAEGPGAPLAAAVMASKNARKFRVTYVESVLDGLDARGRIHPSIHSLQARTARMSVSGPPLQQLPSGDWTIRRGFVADEGTVIGAADLDQVELRVLAALAKESTMTEAIRSGVDLHTLTAESAGVPRKVGKMANFLVVYGGGAGKLARSAGIPLAEAQRVLKGYHRTYPGVKRLSRSIQEQCDQGRLDVVTPTGRHIPMDRARSYAGLNYLVQSTARDVLGQGLIRMDEAGLTDHLLMAIHDEVLYTAPKGQEEELNRAFGEALTFRDFLGSGIDLTATGETYGASWGHGYGAPS